MPGNIATFDSNTRVPTADSAGSQAYETEGRHVEASYAQAGNAIGGAVKTGSQQLEQHYEIQETSANSAQASAILADQSTKLTQAANSAAADPANAQKYFQDYHDGLNDALSQIGTDNITRGGQENAERHRATLLDAFTQKSDAAQSIVGGQVVRSNMENSQNMLSQAVSNDPTLLPTAIKMFKGSLEDQLVAHQMSPEENARLRNEYGNNTIKGLSIAAFQTMAQRDPAAARDALTKGVFATAFNGEEIGHLTAYANEQEKALSTAQKAQIEQQKQADKADFNAQASQVVGSMLQPDGSLRIAPGAPQKIVALSQHPGAAPGEIKSLADMTQAILKDQAKGVKAVSDPATYQSFGTKMVQGNLSAQEIYEARTNGQLSDKDTSYFIRGVDKLAQDPARKEAEKQFNQWAMAQKPAFTTHSLFSTADPDGMQKFNRFMQDAHARFDQAYSSKGDWQGLLNAKNPGYLGSIAKGYMSNVKGASLPPPVHVGTVQDAMKLKPGTQFVGADGVLRTR